MTALLGGGTAVRKILESLGVQNESSGASTGTWIPTRGPELVSTNPASGERLGVVRQATAEEYEKTVSATATAFPAWSMTPAPRRGEIVRQLGEELRKSKENLGRLVSLEAGKVLSEGLG